MLNKLSKGLDNIPEVAGNKKIGRAGGPPMTEHAQGKTANQQQTQQKKINNEHKLPQ